jgi:hypothetical protein
MISHRYGVQINAYEQNQQIKSNCNSIQFYNQGTSNVTINNQLTLIGGQSFTIEGNENEMCVTDFNLTFDNTAVNNCLVTKKTYLK